jgi:NAD(P)-dependent dehydrogenase (short-subunit alcohol dehydrogenase family)
MPPARLAFCRSADRVVADVKPKGGKAKAKGGKAIAVKGDVSKAADVRRLFDETKKALRHARRAGE